MVTCVTALDPSGLSATSPASLGGNAPAFRIPSKPPARSAPGGCRLSRADRAGGKRNRTSRICSAARSCSRSGPRRGRAARPESPPAAGRACRHAPSRRAGHGCRDGCGASTICSTGASSTILPAYMTPIRSETSTATPISWVTKDHAKVELRAAIPGSGGAPGSGRSRRAPWSARRPGSRLDCTTARARSWRAGACRPTSRADRPLAAAPARGCAPAPTTRGRAARRRFRSCRCGGGSSRRSDGPTVKTGSNAVAGSWKIMATRPPRRSPKARGPISSTSSPSMADAARPARAMLGMEPQDRAQGDALARARFALECRSVSPRLTSKLTRSPRARCGRRDECEREGRDLQQIAHVRPSPWNGPTPHPHVTGDLLPAGLGERRLDPGADLLGEGAARAEAAA